MATEYDGLGMAELVLRLGAGLALGALIGLERQWRQRLAGLRTNSLVALGAAAFTAFSMLESGDVSPTRVAAQVASGIGFLGAGVIMREGVNVRGLNTAATLWCAAAVGVLAGAGYLAPALLVALLVLIANVALRPLAVAVGQWGGRADELDHLLVYRLEIDCEPDAEMRLRALLLQEVATAALQLRRLASRDRDGSVGVSRIDAELVATEPADALLRQIVQRFGLERGVRGIGWALDPQTDES